MATAVVLSGCIALAPGTLTLSQPGGLGQVHMRFVLCTTIIEEPEKEVLKLNCGTSFGPNQGQVMLALVVPAGSTAPQTIAVPPGPGAKGAVLSRDPAVAGAYVSWAEVPPGTVIVPPGTEIVGYSSGVIDDLAAQTQAWSVDVPVGLPPAADGGSYGGPFKATALAGWRPVSAELPATRPFSCDEPETSCVVPGPEFEVEAGVSDLKVGAPQPAKVAPGESVTLPFRLDFASSAAVLPRLALGAASTLPKARLKLSSDTFFRAPTDPATKRAPATTRKVTVTAPPSARPGAYSVALTATAPQGGAVAGAARLVVKRPRKTRLWAPKRIAARVASKRGLPVRAAMPTTGSRLALRLLAPKKAKLGKRLLAKRVRKAKRAGGLKLRVRIPARKAAALAAAKAKVAVRAVVVVPGKKPRKLRRATLVR